MIVKVKEQDVLIDDEDISLFESHTWHLHKGYVCTNIKKKSTVPFHRLVLNANNSKHHVDHKNGNTLDNRKSNLRFATIAENARNRPFQKNNKTGYKGVYPRKDASTFRAQIRYQGKKYGLGSYKTAKEAALAYNNAAVKFYGEFAWLNPIED